MAQLCHRCGASCKEDDRFCAHCGATVTEASSEDDAFVGRTIGGGYTVQELVGVGGMGRVYRAEQTALGRTVAIKVIHPHLLSDDDTVARFYTEARASSRLNHPNSVSIIDFGRTDDGILYLVMEFLQGKDLAMVMHEEGPLSFSRITDAMDGVLGALGEAHELGVVHRDLKPENIIFKKMRGGDLVKVVDFGLATIVSGGGATSITAPGVVCGTPDYMSPEQGRGENVDGRGDLYSLGVVLFELLTDQLPYDDETPTKVVLRHINDPIPDPMQVAPHRQIPKELAAIAVKSLAKSREDRFQNADEMQQALREAQEARRAGLGQEAKCPTCGALSPSSMRFCGSCGARITGLHSVPSEITTPHTRPSFAPVMSSTRPFVGRDKELSRLETLRRSAGEEFVWAHVTGDVGAGKTRLLAEVALAAEKSGDLVVGATPHPVRSPVPYHAIRELVLGLLDVDLDGLKTLTAGEASFADPLMRAGLMELVEPTGLRGYDDRSRAGAVAEALLGTVLLAQGRAGAERVVLLVDDLTECDGLTKLVLEDLLSSGDRASLFCVTSGSVAVKHEGVERVDVGPLALPVASKFLAGHDGPRKRASTPPTGDAGGMLPLYLEQAQALGSQSAEDEVLPPRLADVVAQRLDRLDLAARRMLQAAAVLGHRCKVAWLPELLESEDLGALEVLEKHRLISAQVDIVEITHPFIRAVVEASIPAEARRRLHRRALQLASARSAPLEVRAEHAYRAGEPMSALMLLERMGDTAVQRGDLEASVLAFSRALELARRELLETGDAMLEGGILTFSRRLGDALERHGEVARADGVLREALDLAGPHSIERARLLHALARVAVQRDRRRDAVRFLGQALEIATGQEAAVVEARIQVEIARVRRSDGDALGAANAYRRADELLASVEGEAARRTRTLVELSEALVEVGDTDGAAERLEEARKLAKELELPAIVALTMGALGTIREMDGVTTEAVEHYRAAATAAAEAGDAEGRDRWCSAVEALGAAV